MLAVFAGLIVGLFVAALDQTIVATALPTIAGEVGGLDQYSWTVTAYLLTATASVPLYGKIGDQYGRKPVFEMAMVVFIVGSVVSGAAGSVPVLVLGRAVQGLGAGGIIALTSAIVGDIVSPRERGKYQGILGAVFGFASLIGPLLGGLFTETMSWRLVFWINVPLGLIALAIIRRSLRVPARHVVHALDIVGAGLIAGAIVAILLATVWGGRTVPWDSPLIAGLLVGGAILALAFILWERRAPEPLMPLRLFRDRSVAIPIVTSGLFGVAFFGAVVYLPAYLQVVRGYGPTTTGMLLLPLVVGIFLASAGSGLAITRTGRYKAYPVAGLIILAVSSLWLSTLDADTAMEDLMLRILILGVGLGLVIQNLVVALQNAAEPRDLGVATSTNLFFRSMGGALGTALFGALLTSSLGSILAGDLMREAVALGIDPGQLTGTPDAIRALPGSLRQPVQDAFIDGLREIFLVSVPFALAGLLLMLRLRELPLRETTGLEEIALAAGSPD